MVLVFFCFFLFCFFGVAFFFSSVSRSTEGDDSWAWSVAMMETAK